MGFWVSLIFWVLAAGAVATSIGVLVFRNPLYSALSLIADFFCFAGLYAMLSAHFLAVVQVLVYAGAIMVLFVFIIMLLNLGEDELGTRQFGLHQILAFAAGIGFFAFAGTSIVAVVDGEKVRSERAQYQKELQGWRQADGSLREIPLRSTPSKLPGLYADLGERAAERAYRRKLLDWQRGGSTPAEGEYRPFDPNRSFEIPPALAVQSAVPGATADGSGRTQPAEEDGLFGTAEPVSILLVNRFVIPFELTAILLLAAIIGAVIIGKKRV